jgi:hypothetical protein
MSNQRGDTEITGDEDMLDSRDIEARIDYLESERSDLEETIAEAQRALDDAKESTDTAGEDEDAEEPADPQEALDAAQTELAEWDEFNKDELDALKALRDEYNGGEWRHGATFIADSYFQDYAEQMAEDIGAIDRDAKWPLDHIDWEAAADELKVDYTSYTIFGTDFWSHD